MLWGGGGVLLNIRAVAIDHFNLAPHPSRTERCAGFSFALEAFPKDKHDILATRRTILRTYLGLTVDMPWLVGRSGQSIFSRLADPTQHTKCCEGFYW